MCVYACVYVRMCLCVLQRDVCVCMWFLVRAFEFGFFVCTCAACVSVSYSLFTATFTKYLLRLLLKCQYVMTLGNK